MNAKRDLNILSAVDSALITGLGALVGANAVSAGNAPWIADDSTGCTWSNEFFNQAEEDLILMVWGPVGSWVNAVAPQISASIPHNTSRTICFPSGWSGAWAPIYSDTKLVNGQVSETWGEGTFNAPYSVVDVSREVNMYGKPMSIVGPQCTTDMTTCSFQCAGGAASCMTGYQLVNCATGSQAGANFGTYDGADSGGCGGMGNAAALKTYLG